VISCFKPFKVFLPFKQSLMSQTLEELMAKMFVGKAGWWRDYFDLTTAFTDTAGTTAISAVDQTYALHLDKSRGMVVGSEMITPAANSEFTSDTGYWTLESGRWSITGGQLVASGGGLDSVAVYSGVLTSGTGYLGTIVVTAITGTLYFGTGGAFGYEITAPGTYQIQFVASGSRVGVTLGGDAVAISSISYKQISGTHATQATGAARPKYFNRYNRLTYSEDFSNAVWQTAGLQAFGGGSISAAFTTAAGVDLDFLAQDGTTGNHVTYRAYPGAVVPSLFRFYAKAGTKTVVSFDSGGASAGTAVFDLSAVSVTGITGATIAAVESGVYLCEIPLSAPTGNFGILVGLAGEAGTAGFGAYVGGASLVPVAFTDVPYQRVVSSPYDLATRTNDYDQDATKFPYYAEYDLVDDKLSLTAPAITGQIAIATTLGLWIDDITVAAGTFDNGPTTYTGGPAGLVGALGAQPIAEIIREGTFTQAEIDLMLAVYLPKGCPGLITLGSDLMAGTGVFASDTGWTVGVGWAIGSGVATAVAALDTTNVKRASLATAGKYYLSSFEVTSFTSGAFKPFFGVVGTSGTARAATGTHRDIVLCTSGTDLGVMASGTTSGAIDNVSFREIIFP